MSCFLCSIMRANTMTIKYANVRTINTIIMRIGNAFKNMCQIFLTVCSVSIDVL
jgi:hypothetical protein